MLRSTRSNRLSGENLGKVSDDHRRSTGRVGTRRWQDEVRRLAARARRRRARPQLPVARDPGRRRPRRRLARPVADRGRAPTPSTIVFCGVHFMAETAKLLSPDKTVLVPTAAAGCSLADTIDADQLRAWKAEHPGAVVVAYVNTSAAVKAEADICCTSSNAVEVVESIDPATPGAVPARPVPRRARAPDDRPRQHRGLAGRVPRARRHQPGRRARPGGRAPRRRAAGAPRVRLRVLGDLAGRRGRPAGRPHPDHVDRRDGRRGPHDDGAAPR